MAISTFFLYRMWETAASPVRLPVEVEVLEGFRAGPAERTTGVAEALDIILESAARRPTELVPLAKAAGRVLADAITAREDLWPFPRAAMDGVAVRRADLAGASEAAPVTLRVRGAIFCGQVWDGGLGSGEALRIATGAPMPPGADAVVPRELLRWGGEEVLIGVSPPEGWHVFAAGEDARAGESVLEAGTLLGGGQIGLLAALGYWEVPVVGRAAVAILATGDELVSPDSPLKPGQVRESNSYVLAAEVASLGADPRLLGVAPDDAEQLEAKVREGLRADALVICGGVSVGERDLVRGAIERAGVRLRFVGVAMKPGAPVAFGLSSGCLVFALPGTPGAARIAFEVLVRPALCALMGMRQLHRPATLARLSRQISVKPGRLRYIWARAGLAPSGVEVAPLPGQGTATLRSGSDANALVVIEPGQSTLPEGSRVGTLLLAPIGLPTAPGRRPFVLGITGAPGAGKTTLIERLIPALADRGIKVAVVKHHSHMDATDEEGTDTWRAERAGAEDTVLVGPAGLVKRKRASGARLLDQALAESGPADVILVEGFGQSSLPKLLVCRAGAESDRPAPAEPVVAVVGDAGTCTASLVGRPSFGWDEMGRIADFVLAQAQEFEGAAEA